MMRALTLRQPWAYAVTHLGKRVENRTRRPPDSLLGRDIAIHAGLGTEDVISYLRTAGLWRDPPTDPEHPFAEPYPRGAIVAVARVRAYEDDDGVGLMVEGDYVREEEILSSPWYTGPIGILLADVRVLTEPVPCRGMQGYWPVPADVEAAVLARLP